MQFNNVRIFSFDFIWTYPPAGTFFNFGPQRWKNAFVFLGGGTFCPQKNTRNIFVSYTFVGGTFLTEKYKTNPITFWVELCSQKIIRRRGMSFKFLLELCSQKETKNVFPSDILGGTARRKIQENYSYIFWCNFESLPFLKRRGIYFCFFLIFFVFRGFWLLAFVAFGFCGFWLLWLSWLSWLLWLLAFWPIRLSVYTYIYLSIYLSFFWQLFSFLFLYLLFLLFSLQRRNQTRKQASKQARAAHLWIWCAAGGGAAPPPTPPAPRNLHFIPDTRACHEINILR